jgi:hypothetical protein
VAQQEQTIYLNVPDHMKRLYDRASNPWPIIEPKLQQALDIAMDYLEITGRCSPYYEVERRCAAAILDSWKLGVRHRVALAHRAITAIEKKQPDQLESFYPRAG